MDNIYILDFGITQLSAPLIINFWDYQGLKDSGTLDIGRPTWLKEVADG